MSNMKLEILMSTMNQKDLSIIGQNNIDSDTIIINQTNTNYYLEKRINNNLIKMYSYKEIGIGKSRNRALISSKADICLLADDDVKYSNNYKEKILNEFQKNKDVDVIIFDLDILEKYGYREYRNSEKKINKTNFMKHGGPKIAFRRNSIIKNNIFFSHLFGGGSKYGSGEDSLFLKMCLDAGLKIVESEVNIGEVDNRKSTWFNGYNKKYFHDKGALYRVMYPKIWPLICLQYIIRHHRNDGKLFTKLNQMIEGGKNY